MGTWAVKANWQMHAFLSCHAVGARNGTLLGTTILIVKGVWATRPQPSCPAVKEGESPTFILSGDKGGRVALIHPVWR